MAEQAVIREFLVSLGFKKDEGALKQFVGGVESATKSVLKLGAVIEGTALAVALGVTRFANNLEQLYFASQRTGTSATNLEAFSRAAQNFGASADEARGAVEGLAEYLRRTPGGENIVSSLFGGVNLRDAHGNARQLTDVMVDIGNAMAKMPTYQAEWRGQQIGLSDHMVLALRNGDFSKSLADAQKHLGGGWDKAAQDAHRFDERLRELLQTFDRIKVRIGTSLLDRFQGDLDKLATWLDQHGDELAKRLADALLKLIAIAEKLLPALGWVYSKFVELDKATDGWSTKILAAVAALKLLGGFEVIGGISKLAGALGGLALGPVGKVLLAMGAIAGVAKLYQQAQEDHDTLPAHSPTRAARWFDELTTKLLGGARSRAITSLSGAGSLKNEAAARGIVDVLSAESGLNPTARNPKSGAYGIAQWLNTKDAPYWDEFKQWSGGRDIHQSTFGDQLRFLAYQLTQGSNKKLGGQLSKETSEYGAIDLFTRQFERPGVDTGKDIARAMTFAPHITVHVVDQSGYAPDTARAIRRELEDVTGDMMRSFAFAAQ